MENRYNLIDEKWINSNIGMISLKECFANANVHDVGSTTTEKLCLLKFFIAIGQASVDFDTVDDIADAGVGNVRNAILDYLDAHHEQFWLYGDRPFLQFPALAGYDASKYFVEYRINQFDENHASGNNGVFVDAQVKHEYDDADKANMLIVNLGSPIKYKCFKGKKNHVVFTRNKKYIKALTIKEKEKGKVKEKVKESADNCCCGFFNGLYGYLHGFVTGKSVMDTVFMNILSNEEISDAISTDWNGFVFEKGVPPWEIDSLDEEHDYKNTYYSFLAPMNRFILFNESMTMFRITEGIPYFNINENNEMEYNHMLSQPDIFVYNNLKDSNNKKEADDETKTRKNCQCFFSCRCVENDF